MLFLLISLICTNLKQKPLFTLNNAITPANICFPIFLLLLGMDPSNKKFDTLRQRLQSKIKEADNLSHGRNGSVLPILTRDVFIQVLIQSGVPLIQCPAEADWEIACLAQEWKCPVLTNDSDFYIFDLPGVDSLWTLTWMQNSSLVVTVFCSMYFLMWYLSQLFSDLRRLSAIPFFPVDQP